MTVISTPCKYPHRVIAVMDIELGNGVIVPKGTQGWLVSHAHLWNEPDVDFDGFGICGLGGGETKAIRINGRLIRRSTDSHD